MQSVSVRIWTCVALSISYNDNHDTTGTSMSWNDTKQSNGEALGSAKYTFIVIAPRSTLVWSGIT